MANASPSSSFNCDCDLGFVWNELTEACEVCPDPCNGCNSIYFTGCIGCVIGYKFLNNICDDFCPTGYREGFNTCDALGEFSGHVLSLVFNKVEDVVVDSRDSKFKCLTGIDNDFYPNYGTFDPYAAYERGYYFHGGSIMQLPPNAEDSSDSLVISNEHSMIFWLKPVEGSGTLFTKQ